MGEGEEAGSRVGGEEGGVVASESALARGRKPDRTSDCGGERGGAGSAGEGREGKKGGKKSRREGKE